MLQYEKKVKNNHSKLCSTTVTKSNNIVVLNDHVFKIWFLKT